MAASRDIDISTSLASSSAALDHTEPQITREQWLQGLKELRSHVVWPIARQLFLEDHTAEDILKRISKHNARTIDNFLQLTLRGALHEDTLKWKSMGDMIRTELRGVTQLEQPFEQALRRQLIHMDGIRIASRDDMPMELKMRICSYLHECMLGIIEFEDHDSLQDSARREIGPSIALQQAFLDETIQQAMVKIDSTEVRFSQNIKNKLAMDGCWARTKDIFLYLHYQELHTYDDLIEEIITMGRLFPKLKALTCYLTTFKDVEVMNERMETVMGRTMIHKNCRLQVTTDVALRTDLQQIREGWIEGFGVELVG